MTLFSHLLLLLFLLTSSIRWTFDMPAFINTSGRGGWSDRMRERRSARNVNPDYVPKRDALRSVQSPFLSLLLNVCGSSAIKGKNRAKHCLLLIIPMVLIPGIGPTFAAISVICLNYHFRLRRESDISFVDALSVFL